MAVVLGNLRMFLATDGMVLLMHIPILGAFDFAFAVLLMDGDVLVGDAVVHLIATGMIPIPLRLGMSTGGQAEDGSQGERVAGATLNDHRTKLLIPNLDRFG
jgi:hypothetical protein